MYLVQTQLSFEAAHRLYDVATYSEECRDNIHGHSYKINVNVSCKELNEAGMVIDFKKLKHILKETIEDRYDHSCIIRECDPLKDALLANCKKVIVVEGNPTAEWMAKNFGEEIERALNHYQINGVRLEQVEVQETENNIAIWQRDRKLAAQEEIRIGGQSNLFRLIPVLEAD